MAVKSKNPAETMSELDRERLFGDGVDLFKSYYAVKFLHNIISKIGLRDIHDNDFYRAIAKFVTVDEVSVMYDKILPPDKRSEIRENHHFRTPPELNDDDNILEDLGASSLEIVEMTCEIEDTLGITIDDAQIIECRSIRDVCEMIESMS